MTTAMEPKPTIVIVPAAWHKPIHYERLASRLEAADYKFHTIDVPSSSDDPTIVDFNPDIQAIKQTLEQAIHQHHEEVLLVLHSASGVAGSEAAKDLLKSDLSRQNQPGGVIHIVYISAFAAPEGISIFGSTRGPSAWVDVEGPLCAATNVEELFYNTCTAEDAAEAKAQLTSGSTGNMWSRATYAAWKHVECTYLVCEKDNAIPLFAQEAMIAHPEAKFKVERCARGHAPMVDMPDFVAEVIRRAAGEKV